MRVLVDRRVDRKIETKVAYYHTYFNPTHGISYSQIASILPELPQAGHTGSLEVDRETRVGSQVIAQSLYVRGWINCVYEQDEPDWSTILARLFCVSDKSIKYVGQLSGGMYQFTSELLRKGSEATDYDGTPESQLMPVNSDRITTHHQRTFNFAGDQAHHTGFTGELRVKTIPFSFSVKCKNKVLKFAEPDDKYPHNFAPVMALGWTCANGNTPSGSPLRVEYTSLLRYKDA